MAFESGGADYRELVFFDAVVTAEEALLIGCPVEFDDLAGICFYCSYHQCLLACCSLQFRFRQLAEDPFDVMPVVRGEHVGGYTGAVEGGEPPVLFVGDSAATFTDAHQIWESWLASAFCSAHSTRAVWKSNRKL